MSMPDPYYERLGRLGGGTFGEVFKGRKKGGQGEICAIKYISSFRIKREMNDILNEINIMKRISHPHIIRFIESYEISGYIVVVTECASQELYAALKAIGSFPEDKVNDMACQLCSAIYYLHANKILHRDLKPENILVMEDNTVRVCDFGFARAMGEAYFATTIKRTPVYMAPEIAKESFVSYNEKVDIWALGCIIYELLAGDPPFFSNNYVALGMKILNSPVSWPTDFPLNLKDLLQQMLTKNPRERISWPRILDHPWFKGAIKVSQEDMAKQSPYTKPELALIKEEEYKTKVRILGTGGVLDATDGAEGDEDVDVIILIGLSEEDVTSATSGNQEESP